MMFELTLLLVAFAIFVFLALLARRGLKPALRPLEAYNQLDALVGQAVESGGRVHIALGPNSLTNEDAATTLAGLAMLELVTDSAHVSDLTPVATSGDATTWFVLGDTMLRVYRRRDLNEKFQTVMPRLVALDPITYAGGISSLMTNESIRTNIAMGSFGSELMLITESASRRGILQIVGSDRLDAQAVAYASSRYPLLGEEFYMARAYLSDTPSAIAGAATEDILRWILIALIIGGTILTSLGLVN